MHVLCTNTTRQYSVGALMNISPAPVGRQSDVCVAVIGAYSVRGLQQQL